MRPRILVVEDSRVMQSLVKAYLADVDADVSVVSNAEAALERFSTHGADVVVSDVQMGEMTGIELCRRLKKACGGRVRVILISGAKGEVGTEAYSVGHADAFLKKPIDGGRLNRLVRSFLGTEEAASGEVSLERPRIRVLCADDTRVGRRILARLVESDPELELVAVAEDGYEAVERSITERPQLVLMDALMPGLGGIEATQRIMQRAPTRIVIVTDAHAGQGARAAFEATRVGALDLLPKPTFIDPSGPEAAAFLERLKELADVPVVRRRRLSRPIVFPSPAPERATAPIELVALCGSTGGPRVLAQILPSLRAALTQVPVLIVQHVLPGFDAQLTRWLRETTGAPVQLATAGARLRSGTITIAPNGRHMVLAGKEEIDLVDGRRGDRHVPSGDELFASVATRYGRGALAVVLTGMGEDGLAGVRAVRRAGGTVLAQEPTSCVVPGMPEAVIAEGLANEILVPEELGEHIAARVAQRDG